MMRPFFFFLSFVLLVYSAQAQELKLGKINAKEYHDLAIIKDSSAAAIVLKHYRETYFKYDGTKGWMIITKVQQRVKILKKEGMRYATHKVGAYRRDGKEEFVNDIEGFTYTLENGLLAEEKLSKEAVYEQKESDRWDSYSWTMPNVQVGSILEWEYTLNSPFYKVDDLILQQDIPVKEYEGVIRTPIVFQFNKLKKGYFEVTPETEFKKRSDGVIVGQDTGYGLSLINSKSGNITFTEQVDSYTLKDIPALQKETYVDNIENYRYTIVYELKSIEYNEGNKQNYATSWDDVAKSIFKADRFGKQLEKTNFLNVDADVIKRKGTGIELLVKNSFDFIRDSFTWNGKYGKYVEEDLKDVYKSRSGNDAEINLTLIAMLNACGIDASPVLVSTKENGIPVFPTLEGFNYVIAAVMINEKLILLDATEKNGLPNLLPSRVYNWEGRLVRKNGSSKAVNLYPEQPTQQNSIVNYTIAEGGKISGIVMERYTTLNALDFRKNNKGEAIDDSKQKLINELHLDEVKNLKVQNLDALEEPIVQQYNFDLENAYDQVGNTIYLSPLLFMKISENPFKSENRQFPVNFNYPFTETKNLNIRLPEGYQAEHLPEQMNIALPEKMGSFSYKIGQSQNTLNLSIDFTINKAVIPVFYHDALKDFYNARMDKENEKIVLTKIEQ
ncbi:DUF3857 domain-containing protein [Flavimarina sp. Hel_I_48]|uniref:DUF3857 domain-containing protein n=1 Tax=Flavimarina sp. Hel_I_48 TaxID=1392488 RepID=UPI0004DF3404|nr:DUF3857 domain-containing protein [Flavimarina sp. Hel_I_48]